MKERIKKTAEHIGIISIGALETLVKEVREEIIRECEEVKHDPETDSEESKIWIAGFNNCRNQIINKLTK